MAAGQPSSIPRTPAAPALPPRYEISSVMASVDLGCTVDLVDLTLRASNAQLSEKQKMVIIALKAPKATAKVYAKGNLTIWGAKSEDDAVLAAMKVARMVYRFRGEDRSIKRRVIEICSIAASCNIGFPVHLHKLSAACPMFASYEAEAFPALKYYMKQPKVTIEVFSTGKLNISGAKSRNQVEAALIKIVPILQQFRLEPQQMSEN